MTNFGVEFFRNGIFRIAKLFIFPNYKVSSTSFYQIDKFWNLNFWFLNIFEHWKSERWCYLCKLKILSSSYGSSRAATNAFQELNIVKFADPLSISGGQNLQFWSYWRSWILIFVKIPHLRVLQITKISKLTKWKL